MAEKQTVKISPVTVAQNEEVSEAINDIYDELEKLNNNTPSAITTAQIDAAFTNAGL